jgi:hypothetical protein
MSALTVQLEREGAGFIELSREALAGYAQALAQAWSALGVGVGDRVAIYDYGSSPVAYLASQTFSPYLERGAAEHAMAMALCVDGLPDNIARFAHVLRHFQPHFAFVRADLLPLLISGPTALPTELRAARLVISADGDIPAPGERAFWQRAWHGGVSLLARHDPAAFIAAECPRCATLRVPEDLYEIELRPAVRLRAVGGSDAPTPDEHEPRTLAVAARFLDLGPVETELSVRGGPRAAGCPHEGLELA